MDWFEFAKLSALALAPIIFVLVYVYLKDEFDREPLKYLVITFVLGFSTAFPVVYVGGRLSMILGVSVTSPPLELILYAFVVVALTEEAMKFIVLRFYNYPHKEFDEPYDGIMYGVTVSMGFAAIENLLYVLTDTDEGMRVALLRMFTAVPAHAVFGITMGYFVGRAKFIEGRGSAFWELCKGLLIAVILHGLYDYFLFLRIGYIATFSFVLLAAGVYFANKAMKMHQDISPHRPEDGF
ncbi:MAG: PrsW family glutamic-type intramembrane protease [Bacteroidota bacterium]